jgi:hypothetical protein
MIGMDRLELAVAIGILYQKKYITRDEANRIVKDLSDESIKECEGKV